MLGGVHVPKGAWLVLVYGSANRDENLFAEGDEFVPDRDRLKEHLAFGKGIHFCLGAPLARLEARVALEELRARITSFELDPSNDFGYIPSFMVKLACANSTGERNRLLANEVPTTTREVAIAIAATVTHTCG